MSTYTDIVEAVKNYYGAGSDQWEEIARYGMSAENAEAILSQVPGVNLIKNTDGSIRSWTYTAYQNTQTGSDIPELINSNTQTGTANPANSTTFNVPSNMGLDSGGKVTLKSGMKTAGNFVMSKVAPAVAATGLGITLGKTISSAAYNSGFNWLEWAGVNLESLNPQSWAAITDGDDSFGAKLFNFVFGIDANTGETQAYMDEEAAAYMAYYMQQVGMFNSGGVEVDGPVDGVTCAPYFNYPLQVQTASYVYWLQSNNRYTSVTTEFPVKIVTGKMPGTNNRTIIVIVSEEPFLYGMAGSKPPLTPNVRATTRTAYGKTFYGLYFNNQLNISNPDNNLIINTAVNGNYDSITMYDKFAYLALYGSTETPTIPGTGTQEGATTPDLSTATSVQDVLQLLQQQYPDLFTNQVTQDVLQSDGTIKEYHYIPVNLPEATSATDQSPTTGEGKQGQPKVNPETSTETLVDTTTKLISTPPTSTDIPDTGSGSSPTIVTPTGSAAALFAIYNPSQAEINSFGAWLWSPNFVDPLLKLFNDPMQSIIGLHKIFAPPQISGAGTIHVGYLDSGVSSNLVGSQYTNVDCGTVNLLEYFGNVFDYAPYTDVNIFLPFIGIQKLSVADVMRSSIHVVYHVDVLTGACLADVEVIRDGSGGVIYSYAGDCAVRYPISSGSYMGIVASIASVVGGIIGTVATGGALAPVAMGAVGGALNAHTDVNHSGSFSGNAGAMGIKKPYLIISRPQTALADNFPMFDGYPANHYTTVGSCSGYIRANSCHVENVPATDKELGEIESLLLTGVII